MTELDLTNMGPTRTCVCGSDTFKVLVRFDEYGDIVWHTLTGYCANEACHAKVIVPSGEVFN